MKNYINWSDLTEDKQRSIKEGVFGLLVNEHAVAHDIEVIWQGGKYIAGVSEEKERQFRDTAERICQEQIKFTPITLDVAI